MQVGLTFSSGQVDYSIARAGLRGLGVTQLPFVALSELALGLAEAENFQQVLAHLDVLQVAKLVDDAAQVGVVAVLEAEWAGKYADLESRALATRKNSSALSVWMAVRSAIATIRARMLRMFTSSGSSSCTPGQTWFDFGFGLIQALTSPSAVTKQQQSSTTIRS